MTKTVEEVHLVGLEMHGYAMAAPEVGQVTVEAGGLMSGDIGIAGEIVAVVARHIGRIEDRTNLVMFVGQTTDKHAAVIAQSGIIFECSFCFETDNHEYPCFIEFAKVRKKNVSLHFQNEIKIF
jgi:hypothetical protein